MAIIGAHALLYSSQANDLRAMLRDVFGFNYVDAHQGWLIFTLPPAELGIHPFEGSMGEQGAPHSVSFMCDDIHKTVTELRAKGVSVRGEPKDEGFGITVMLDLPGGSHVMLYQPRHPKAIDTNAAMLPRVLVRLLGEALYGPQGGDAFFLNSGDRGLLASLDALSAEAASARPGGRASVASHVEHLRYGFALLNREAKGETVSADWAEAWKHQTVSEEEWRQLRADLARETLAWLEVMKQPPAYSEVNLTSAVSSIPHLTYHLGAIRQLAAAASGPPAVG